MKLRFVLRLLPCLLTVLTACDSEEDIDPVWGDWEGRANGCAARTEFEIDDDYKGDGRVVFDDCSVCQVNIDVDPEDDGEYQLEVDGVDCEGSLDLDCELDDDELECQDSTGMRSDFERG